MRQDFAIKKVFRLAAERVKEDTGTFYNVEQLEIFVDLFLEGMFDAIGSDKDVRIPRFGSFQLNSVSYAGEYKFRELTSNGIIDKDLIKEECDKARAEARKVLNAANARPLVGDRTP